MQTIATETVVAAAAGTTILAAIAGWTLRAFGLGRAFNGVMERHRREQEAMIRQAFEDHGAEERRHLDLMREEEAKRAMLVQGEFLRAIEQLHTRDNQLTQEIHALDVKFAQEMHTKNADLVKEISTAHQRIDDLLKEGRR